MVITVTVYLIYFYPVYIMQIIYEADKKKVLMQVLVGGNG